MSDPKAHGRFESGEEPSDKDDCQQRKHRESRHPNSEPLILRAQHNESETAWRILTGRYRNRLWLKADLLLGTALRRHHNAEDLVQEAWLRVLANFEVFQYRGRDSLFRWLCQQMHRIASEWGRRKQVPRITNPSPMESSLPP